MLFLADAPGVLRPIVRQVDIILAHERSRTRSSVYLTWSNSEQAKREASGRSGSDRPGRVSGHVTALKRAREKLTEVLSKGSESADNVVSASEIKPVLHDLLATINSIELAIEAQVAALDERPVWGRMLGVASGEARALADELESVHYLRRCVLALPVMPTHAMPHRRDSNPFSP